MIGRTFKKYMIFAKSGVQTTIAYRGQVALWFLGAIINAVLMGLLWWAIFSFSPEPRIGGYSYPQMLMYVVLSAVIGEMVFADTMGMIIDDVRYGLIGMRLMKPINYRWQLGFTSIGACAARFAVIGVPMMLIGTLTMVFGFGLDGIVWYNILLFIPACALSLMINDAFQFVFGQLAFRTQAMFGVSSMYNMILSFLSGAAVPLSLFPTWAQTVLEYTPFPFVISLPARLFLGQVGLTDVLISFGISIAWIVVLNVLGQLLYKTSVRKVVVFGG